MFIFCHVTHSSKSKVIVVESHSKHNHSRVSDRFIKAFKKLDLPRFRFHDLRHYSASIMHAIGVPDVYIMQRGGWSSDYTLKQIYRGSMDDYEKKFTEMTNSHFETMQHIMQHKK